ncbi:polysaccharide deacetylase [Yersinia pseudotuberculosis]|uniref:Polysaccharide deacetylase n=1 Tax=Yersinia pseudotuberculosis serotype O:3 (strain YPIII) TaxID=502800 RepID=A0A0H3B6X5_YERPY|nr:polysaccharide deacetylase family protein [Yersinia pseudotuberculosis]MBK1423503.1 polysaccharide deacetylase family protein [Yersinia pseudotuberculosis]CFV21171.1 polysaccharide deacetylase [Yersinia pseudotuberculosis]CND34091.1 polysaccharide deacetylase [Yersinia pseudotuberculosis]CNH91286.1 polysaccharide deacetylase [Yersinia pseudotuberculosis]CNI41712.1 polysaccharide deacetylase [Yersinia pseudotuberculosis]
MWHKNRIAIGMLLSIVMWVIMIPTTQADLLPNVEVTPPKYMMTERDSEVYSLVGEHVIPVGEIKEGQLIQVTPVIAEYYEFKFGNGTGFIDKDDLREINKAQKNNDMLGDLNKPLPNQNILTMREAKVYLAADVRSEQFAVLAENLRYPLVGKLKDRLSNTWYQVNIGDRLGYVSSADAEIDNGIPILTYHHMLKNEENKRFLNTSTTTSDVAFSNQMAYLKQAGYDTISLYQLEGYLNNKINLPAKVVVLTFDDGLKSVSRYAYPILKENGFRATAFIISSRIKRHPQKWNPDSLQFMSIAELKGIQDVFDIQSHTHFLHRTDNRHHPILLSRSYHNIIFDFERSRRALAQFNPHVIFLSYPFGGFNQTAVNAAKNAGFHLAVTTMQGKVKPGDNPYTLKRLYILRTDSIPTMAERIANQPGSVAVKPAPAVIEMD